MTELEVMTDEVLREDFERLKKKVSKVLGPILEMQRADEIIIWVQSEFFKEADRVLKESHEAINNWRDNK
jgi:hypothetical protein